LASSINLFTIWTILLLALGFSVAGRRVSYGKALILVVLPWLLYVLVRVAYAAAFGA
jgi:Na+/phosphate symporter